DMLADAPLLREIQRVMLASTGPVNWELARQIGIATASWGGEDPTPTDQDRRGFEETVRAAELAVSDFTSLPVPSDMARVEVFRRAQWVEANTRGLKDILDPVAARLSKAMTEQTGAFGAEGMGDAAGGFLPG